MSTHSPERDLKVEQHHVAPDMPDDPAGLEAEKRRIIGTNVATIATVAAIFIVAIIVAIAVL